MFARLNLFFLISYAVSGMAGTVAPNWDCTQTADNEEWVCASSSGTEGEAVTQDTATQDTATQDTATQDTATQDTATQDTATQDTAVQPKRCLLLCLIAKAIEDTFVQDAAPTADTGLAGGISDFSFGHYVVAGSQDAASPPGTTDRSGWDCKIEADENDATPDYSDEKWACHLTGQDPKGLGTIVASDEIDSGFGYQAFDAYQEQMFKRMQTDFAIDPWANCVSPQTAGLNFAPDLKLRKQAPLKVTADYSEVFDKEITTFSGNVILTRADQTIKADRTTYDSVSQTMDAQGSLYYREKGLSLFADTALLRLANDQARMRNALFVLPAGPTRGSAKIVYRDSSVLSRFKDVVYTSCEPGSQDWALHASRLKINQETGKVSAKHARIDFYGIPLLYSPYLSFPIDNRRVSGFLSPSFGHNNKDGYDLSLPYYWNIAPNYDATFRPRVLSRRGILLAGDFRYLTESSGGKIAAEYLPYDSSAKKVRGQFSWKNASNFYPGLNSAIDINYISDDNYQHDLGGTLSNLNNRHIRSRANLSYNTTGAAFNVLFENYQTIDNIPSEKKPYRRIPKVTQYLEKTLEFNELPFKFALDNEFVYFQRSDDDTGQRLTVEPSVSILYSAAGGFVEPKLALHHSQYWLRNSKLNNLNRTLPALSVDAGLFFDKDIKLAGSPFVQTIEPRLFYHFVPFEEQQAFTNFDTAEYDFNFSQLFRGERFNGGDRIGDANQLSLGIASRFIDSKTGQERLKVELGQIYYFRDRKVTLPGQPIETGEFSNLIVGISSQLTKGLSYTSVGQWSPDKGDIIRGEAFFRYQAERQLLNLGYRYREQDIYQGAAATKQGEISMLWPLYGEWSLFGRWLYSIEENLTPDVFGGFQKESCCWRFRILGRREIRDSKDDPNFGILVQLELKGLVGFGSKIEDFLKRNISGYRLPSQY